MVLIALSLFAVVLILVARKWGPLHTVDLDIANGLNSTFATSPRVVDVWKAVSLVGQPLTFQVLAVIAGVLLWRTGRMRVGLFAVVTVLGGAALGTIVKMIVDRARPVVHTPLSHAHGSSFPSGHALTSMVAMAVLVVVGSALWRGSRTLLVISAVVVVAVVGFSRLALGVHYLSDVTGAWLLGLAWVTAMTEVFALSSQPDLPTRRR